MKSDEFIKRAKFLLNKICQDYSKGWQNRILRNDEYPEEIVCSKCAGFGIFIENGEEKACFQDKEQGECFHRFCDYEHVGMELETYIDKIHELLLVDKFDKPEAK